MKVLLLLNSSSVPSREIPLVSGRNTKKNAMPTRATAAYVKKAPGLPAALDSVRNV